MDVSFTGSRKGMTKDQKQTLATLLTKKGGRTLLRDEAEFHFGWCIGADNEAAMIAGNLGYKLIAHPGDQPWMRGSITPHTVWVAKTNLERNRDIVEATRTLIACPDTFEERMRSGTWSTIRYARQMQSSILIIVPSGSTLGEGPNSEVRLGTR